jgi:hypothetical protein
MASNSRALFAGLFRATTSSSACSASFTVISFLDQQTFCLALQGYTDQAAGLSQPLDASSFANFANRSIVWTPTHGLIMQGAGGLTDWLVGSPGTNNHSDNAGRGEWPALTSADMSLRAMMPPPGLKMSCRCLDCLRLNIRSRLMN